MEKKIPLMYLIMHETLIKNYQLSDVSKVELFNVFSRNFRIKKVFWYPMLKEMEDYKLLKYYSGRNSYISILKPPIDLNNTSNLYKSVGLY